MDCKLYEFSHCVGNDENVDCPGVDLKCHGDGNWIGRAKLVMNNEGD